MPKETLKNITHVFHDWDGVYTFYTDFDAFWKMTGVLAVEAGVFDCKEKARKVIKEIYLTSKKTDKPYESAYEVLHHEFGVPLDYCIKRHHEILLENYKDSFQVLEGVSELMQELTHLEHIVVTHANNHWIREWSKKAGTSHCYKHIVCCAEDGLARKDSGNELYRYLEERFGVKPENCLLIDDSLANLESAHNAGWKTAWCQSNDLVSKTAKEIDYVDIRYTSAKDVLRDLIEHTA